MLVRLGRYRMRNGGGQVLAERNVFTLPLGCCAIMYTMLWNEHFTMVQEAYTRFYGCDRCSLRSNNANTLRLACNEEATLRDTPGLNLSDMATHVSLPLLYPPSLFPIALLLANPTLRPLQSLSIPATSHNLRTSATPLSPRPVHSSPASRQPHTSPANSPRSGTSARSSAYPAR